MKNISLNFKIATNILKTAVKLNIQNRSCIYCKEWIETIYQKINIAKQRIEMQKEVDFYARNIHNGG